MRINGSLRGRELGELSRVTYPGNEMLGLETIFDKSPRRKTTTRRRQGGEKTFFRLHLPLLLFFSSSPTAFPVFALFPRIPGIRIHQMQFYIAAREHEYIYVHILDSHMYFVHYICARTYVCHMYVCIAYIRMYVCPGRQLALHTASSAFIYTNVPQFALHLSRCAQCNAVRRMCGLSFISVRVLVERTRITLHETVC